MGREIIKNFVAHLVTEDPTVVAYLDGYLSGVHDVGWIRMHKLQPCFGNKWLVDILEKNIAYATMNAHELQMDLNKSLELGLSNLYRGMPGRQVQYKYSLFVNEMKPSMVENYISQTLDT